MLFSEISELFDSFSLLFQSLLMPFSEISELFDAFSFQDAHFSDISELFFLLFQSLLMPVYLKVKVCSCFFLELSLLSFLQPHAFPKIPFLWNFRPFSELSRLAFSEIAKLFDHWYLFSEIQIFSSELYLLSLNFQSLLMPFSLKFRAFLQSFLLLSLKFQSLLVDVFSLKFQILIVDAFLWNFRAYLLIPFLWNFRAYMLMPFLWNFPTIWVLLWNFLPSEKWTRCSFISLAL